MIFHPMQHALSLMRLVSAAFLWISAVSLVQAQPHTTLPVAAGTVVLEIHGDIRHADADGIARYDWAMLQALPPASIKTHTSVTDGPREFDGFLIRDLLAHVGASGATVVASALNDYVIEFPVQEFHDYDVILAYAMDGKRLQPSDRGPLWIIYPRDDHPELQDIRYDYRWVWQVIRLDVL